MVEIEKIAKWGLIGAVAAFGGYTIWEILKSQGIITELPQAEKTQIVSTSGVTQNYRPRTSYVLGNGGSVKEIIETERMPENHMRGTEVAGVHRVYRGTFGSIPLGQATGTFNGVTSGLTIPEEIHVTPQLEAALAQSVQRRTWKTGGSTPVTGTFG